MENTLLRIMQGQLSKIDRTEIACLNEHERNQFAAIHYACSMGDMNDKTWPTVRVILCDLQKSSQPTIRNFAMSWYPMACFITKEINSPMYNNGDVIYFQLTDKTIVVIYKNNSGMITRKIRNDQILTTISINNFFDQAHVTNFLYQASISNAYDIWHEICEKITSIRTEKEA